MLFIKKLHSAHFRNKEHKWESNTYYYLQDGKFNILEITTNAVNHLIFTKLELEFLKKCLKEFIRKNLIKNWDMLWENRLGDLYICNMNGEFSISKKGEEYGLRFSKKDVTAFAKYLNNI